MNPFSNDGDQQTCTVEPDQKRKKQPRYNVILWDDADHTYEYVIRMMTRLFGHTVKQALRVAHTVDSAGRAICLTTTMEHAEFKRDQILSFGPDFLMTKSKSSMKATIEPVE